MAPRRSDSTRLEALSDGVFAFAATLLVVSLQVPETFDALLTDLSGFGAFAVSFGALLLIWAVHNAFFKRYGLEDAWIQVLNGWLLFVVLFYVFPLKFVSAGVSAFVFGVGAESVIVTIIVLNVPVGVTARSDPGIPGEIRASPRAASKTSSPSIVTEMS